MMLNMAKSEIALRRGANDQARRNKDVPLFDWLLLDHSDHHVNEFAREWFVFLIDCGQFRLDRFADIVVVETHDRDIIRDFQTCRMSGFDQRDTPAIAAGDEPVTPLFLHKLLDRTGGLQAGRCGTARVGNPYATFRVGLTCGTYRVHKSFVSLLSGPGTKPGENKADALAASLDQVFDGDLAGGLTVQLDAIECVVFQPAGSNGINNALDALQLLNRDSRGSVQAEYDFTAAGQKIINVNLCVVLGDLVVFVMELADRESIAVPMRFAFNCHQTLLAGLIGAGRNQYTDQFAADAFELSGDLVGLVFQTLGRLPNAFGGRLADANVRAAAEQDLPRNRARDTRRFGNINQADSCGAIGFGHRHASGVQRTVETFAMLKPTALMVKALSSQFDRKLTGTEFKERLAA